MNRSARLLTILSLATLGLALLHGCGDTAPIGPLDAGKPKAKDAATTIAECSVDAECATGHCEAGSCVDTGPGDASTVRDGGSGGDDASTLIRPDAGPPRPCDDGSDAGPGPFSFNPGGRPSGTLRARDLQEVTSSAHPATNSTIRLWGVVSTTHKTLLSAPDGALSCFWGAWVSDPAGGANSGILLVSFGTSRKVTTDTCTGGGPIPDSIKPGDAWDISGQYLEYCYKPSGGSCADPTPLTEVRVSTMSGIGNAPVPPAQIVSAISLGDNGTLNPTLDGTLVQVRGVSVTDINPDKPQFFGNYTVDSHLYVNDQFHDVAPFAYKPTANDQIRCLTGVLYYSFNHYKILPRGDADIVR